MKALVGAFNQEKALVGAFSVIVQPVMEPMDRFTALVTGHLMLGSAPLHSMVTSGMSPPSRVDTSAAISSADLPPPTCTPDTGEAFLDSAVL